MTGTAIEPLRQTPEPPMLLSLPSDDEIKSLFRLADAFFQSGIYKDLRQAQAAFAKLIIGRDLGLSISQSMQGVQFVQGQVQLHYSILAMVIRARGYRWEKIERSTTRAAARFFDRDGTELDEVEFTMEDADRAGLTKPTRSGEPSMYAKYPRNMLWARMMGDAVRFVIPEATGGVPVYVPGEIDAEPEPDALTEGEGNGKVSVAELPQPVQDVIRFAEELGHPGWANPDAWAYRVQRGTEVLATELGRAQADLQAIREQREAVVEDAVVEPDLPVDVEDPAEEPGAAEDVPWKDETGRVVLEEEPAAESAASEEPATEEPEGDVDVEGLRRRLVSVQRKKPKTKDEEALRDAEIEYIEGQLAKAAETAENPDQGQLI